MKIEVFGPGCRKCSETHELVLRVLATMDVAADVEYVTDVPTMARRGVLVTPTVMIDGQVVSAGSVPKESSMEQWIRERMEART